MQRYLFRPMVSRWAIACVVVACAAGRLVAGHPVAVRIENFTVPPATGPLTFVKVKNLLDQPYAGTVSLNGPALWRIVPDEREVELAPKQVARVPFTVEKAGSSAANSYDCQVQAVGGGATVTSRRAVWVASAPYFKPTIDGDPADWHDAIPVSFVAHGKKTVISTYWNRRSFSMLVAVEEDKLMSRNPSGEDGSFDAVQFAIAPGEAVTPNSPEKPACRFEFLLGTQAGDAKAVCYRLMEPGTPLTATQQTRSLAPLIYEEASVAVQRVGKLSYYECSLPMKPMREQIRPSEGREFCFSVLIHDPDGTGIRDLGAAAGLWPWERNPLAWSPWLGAKWPEEPLFDSKTPWGMCSSKY